MNMWSQERLESSVDKSFEPLGAAVDAGTIPCASMGVVTSDGLRATRLRGRAAITPNEEVLTRDHWFDLASLTKVIATAPSILNLLAAKFLEVDSLLTAVIPDLRQLRPEGAAERDLTFRDCLSHQTFLPATWPLYTLGTDPKTLKAYILQKEWAQGASVYSDINFMLLGIAIERLSGRPLGALELGAGLSFGKPPSDQIVSTEFCHWRDRILRGEVHDENCWALGGAAGHAGLFGTVDGVLDVALRMLNGSAISPKNMSLMRTKVAGNRTCGWEAKSENWSGGSTCSDQTIGHTGFTGTGLWIDFDRGIGWTILTNRVHPSRWNGREIISLRRECGTALLS